MRHRLSTLLMLSVCSLLAAALLSAALAVFSAREMTANLARIDYAHRVYEGYLRLSADANNTFKQFGDQLLLGEQFREVERRELMAVLDADIAEIRRLIALEIELYGSEEIEELELLASIEATLDELLGEYEAVLDETARSPDSRRPSELPHLARILDQSIDERFRAQILEAVTEETEEVAETKEASTVAASRMKLFATAAALLSLLAATVCFWMLQRTVREPVQRLLEGVAALREGHLEHRVSEDAPVEFSELSRAFNVMANQLGLREQALASANADLEGTIARRTAELKDTLANLKESEARRRRLIADVSHELRTPLTIIRGEADIALRGGQKTPDQYEEALRKCRESAKHTALLVDDLLFVARTEANEVRLAHEDVDFATLLPAIVDGARSMLGTDVGHANVAFVASVATAPLRADPARVRQVTTVLLENALRYGRGHVEVRLDAAPGGYSVSVTDDGPGLDEDERERAFERFFRGSNAAQRYSSGAGLGLPVAKAIVEAHGGTIGFAPVEDGNGTCVRFVLPSRAPLKAVS